MAEETRIKLGYFLPILGGTAAGALSVYDVFYTLSTLGQSIFEDVIISSVSKEFFSLQIFIGFSSMVLALTGALLLLRGRFKAYAMADALSTCTVLFSIANPSRYGFQLPMALVIGTAACAALISSGAILGLKLRCREVPGGPLLKGVEVASTVVFSTLYAAMILLLAIPSPIDGYTHIGDVVVFSSALLFGHKVGGLVGILGSVAAGLHKADPRWFVSILAHGLEGAVAGLAKGKSLTMQVSACVAGGFLMASTYFVINIFLKGFPLALISYARDLFVQAGLSIVAGVVVTNIVKRILPQFR